MMEPLGQDLVLVLFFTELVDQDLLLRNSRTARREQLPSPPRSLESEERLVASDGTQSQKVLPEHLPLFPKPDPAAKASVLELVGLEVTVETKGGEMLSELLVDFFPLRKPESEKAITEEVIPVPEDLESFTDRSVAHHCVLTPATESSMGDREVLLRHNASQN
jgi:hypothetical protein